MDDKEMIEVIREARKAGMQTALLMFGALLLVSLCILIIVVYLTMI